jgi:GMP synthase (glutamine-hydrolysing)
VTPVPATRPFLLLATRAEDVAADAEYAAFLRFGGLSPDQLHRVRLEQRSLPPVDLDRYAGVIVGGSPFTSSDAPETKSDVQHRVERELSGLLDEVVARDFPYLGACYGVGTLGVHQGAVVDSQYGEAVGAVTVSLTDAGRDDPVLAGVPDSFAAYVGHKEACSRLPEHAVLLATAPSCPVQMFRVKENLYATQFHPELDQAGLVQRIELYRDNGYFPPGTAPEVIAAVRGTTTPHPPTILANFVRRYAGRPD